MLSRLFAAFALSAALLLSVSGLARAEVTIKAATWVGPKHPINTGGYKPFAERIEKISNGEIKLRLFEGGSLLSPKGVLTGVRDGVADVGMYALTYFPAEFPNASMLADVPVVGDHATIMAAAVSEFYFLKCPDCIKELGSHMLYTGSFSTSNYTLVMRKGEIKTAADMNGKKLRTSTGLQDRWLKTVGATSVSIPSSDMYDAMSRGVIDGAIYAPGGLQTHGLADVAKDITLLPLGTYPVGVLMGFNRDFWNGLSKAHRKMIIDLMPLAVVEATMGYEKEDVAAAETAKEKGVTIHKPSAEITENFRNFLKTDFAVSAKTAEEKKVTNALAKIETYAALVEKWTKLLTPILDDSEKMAALVKSEIYDKIDPAYFGL